MSTGASSEPALLHLCRHGQTEWHAENRYAGSSNVALSDEGRRQADELAQWAARVRPDAVVCSPLTRARETATPAAAELGQTPAIVEGLREQHFGVAEGRTLGELRADDPDQVAAFVLDPARSPFPGSESAAAVAERGVAALREIAAAHAGGAVLVVAHSTLLRLTLCALLGIEIGRYRTVLPRLDNTAITTVRLSAAGPAALLSLNVPPRFVRASTGESRGGDADESGRRAGYS